MRYVVHVLESSMFRHPWALALALGCGADKPAAPSADTATSSVESTCVDADDALRLAWPLPGTDTIDWVTVQHVDLDPGPGLADHTGATGEAAKTYDGHNGVDIGISSFRHMDQGVDVLAAAGGEVIEIVDGQPDRNTTCVEGADNRVVVRHPSGHVLLYLHLRTGSVSVDVGDVVQAGDVLGQVGSSGCSDHPHLHLGVETADGVVLDPFRDALWCDPPPYDSPMNLMESWLLAGPSEQYANPIQDPPSEQVAFDPGDELLAYAVVGGGTTGQSVAATLEGPDETRIGPFPVEVGEPAWRLSTWWWSFSLPSQPGPWSLELTIDGEVVESRAFEVR